MQGKDDRSDDRFEFGANWQRFLGEQGGLDPVRARIARERLLSFLGVEDLKGKTFLDVGSGSGLHSLAAFDAGAERVVSFDYDPNSVAATRSLHKLRGAPEHWTVLQGSVLDEAFMSSLEPADIVYSWGVLHHTGAMWKALENTIRCLTPSSVLFIALYITQDDSPQWAEVKKQYDHAGWLGKQVWLARYTLNYLVLHELRSFRSPLKKVRDYREESRGMSWFIDARDWLGGWPFETATIDEVVDFTQARGLQLTKITTGEACIEYLFRPVAKETSAP